MKHSVLHKIFALLMILTLMLSVPTASAASVERIKFENPAFIRGMDVSSLLSLERSGVHFYTADGREQDLLRILAENGVNYIRVRVWNDPFDSDGNGYGGGNSDVAAAAEIGRRATLYGMKLLVDFHYSDFWADPAKQKAPKAWSGMTVDEKCAAVEAFTLDSLNAIRAAGADIGMVQIGNETTTGIAGENTWWNMSRIFNAGSRAVRAFSPDVKVAIHFTNPERTETMKALADFLHDYKVDYDVFATSYYPYWHGSLSNLTAVLRYPAEKYGKEAMVAETSYAYTLDDSDGHPNTVSAYNNNMGDNLLWSFTPDGQAQEVRAVMNAVNSVGDKGLGVFCWEGAWITVGDTTGLSGSAYTDRLNANQALWESTGSGWASRYSADFDPDDAGRWYGGSAVDNQAFFAPDGRPLSSLSVFADVLGDNFLLGDTNADDSIEVSDVTLIQRRCAEMKTGFSDETLNHGDVNQDGLDIADATFIQRYLIEMRTPCPIGQRVAV